MKLPSLSKMTIEIPQITVVRLVQTRGLTSKMTTGKEKIDMLLCTELQLHSSAIDRVFCYTQPWQTPPLSFFSFFFPWFLHLPSLSWTWRYRKPWNFVKLPKLFPRLYKQTTPATSSIRGSASAWLWNWQPPCNWSTGNFQGRKKAGQPCSHGTGFHHLRYHCQLLTSSIVITAMIPFQVIFRNKNCISWGRACTGSSTTSAVFLNSLHIY